MFREKTTEEQLLELQKEAKLLRDELAKTRADLDYLSMITEVPLEDVKDESV